MKRRILSFSLAALLLSLVVLGSLLPVFAQYLPSPKAAADISSGSNSDYAFDTSGSLTDLKKAIDAQDASGSALNQMVVYVKGGAFGTKNTLTMQYDSAKTDCANTSAQNLTSGCAGSIALGLGQDSHFGGKGDNSLYVFSASYGCEKTGGSWQYATSSGNSNSNENLTINFEVTLRMNKTGGSSALFDSAGNINSSVPLHWMGFGTAGGTGGAVHTTVQSSTQAGVTSNWPIKQIPPACMPPDVPSSLANDDKTDTELSSKGTIDTRIPVLAKADPATLATWKNAGITPGTSTSGNQSDNSSSDASIGCTSTGINLLGLNVPNPLDFIFCGLIKGLVLILQQVDSAINSQLSYGTDGNSDNPNQVFADSNGCSKNIAHVNSCQGYYDAWSNFRNISLGLLVVAGLIVVTSQAIGAEILDAYTIRKVLPRLLIAVIGVTLSWQLMQQFVTFSNDLGFGIRRLIELPFDQAGLKNTLAVSTSNLGLTIIGALAGLEFLGLFGVLSFVATAALAAFIAFMVLILRQIAITLLIIIAPIAIIAYVLPNTNKLYKFWWESFSKALLMFPLIAAFIATGRVFSAIASLEGNDFIHQSIAFFAYFAPYFLIPATFKFAGGALRQIGGFVNDRSRGGFDRLRQFRANQVKKNAAALAAGTRHKENTGIEPYNRFAKRVNPLTAKAANIGAIGLTANRHTAEARLEEAVADKEWSHALHEMQDNAALKRLDGEDDIIQGMMWARMRKDMGDGRGYDDLMRAYLTARKYHDVEGGTARARQVFGSSLGAGDAAMMALFQMSGGTSSGWDPKRLTNEKGEYLDAHGNVVQDAEDAAEVQAIDPATNKWVIGSGRGPDGEHIGGAAEARSVLNQVVKNPGNRTRALAGFRDQASRTNRGDLKGGSFTEDVKLLQELDAKQNHPAAAAEIQERLIRGAADGMSAQQVLMGHPRMNKAMSGAIEDITRRIATSNTSTTDDMLNTLANMLGAIDAMPSAPVENARMFKQKVLDQKIKFRDLGNAELQELVRKMMTKEREEVVYDDATGKPKVENGSVVTRKVQVSTPITEDSEFDWYDIASAARSHERIGRFRREWGSTAEAGAAAAAGATPPTPTPPTPTPPAGGGTPPPVI